MQKNIGKKEKKLLKIKEDLLCIDISAECYK